MLKASENGKSSILHLKKIRQQLRQMHMLKWYNRMCREKPHPKNQEIVDAGHLHGPATLGLIFHLVQDSMQNNTSKFPKIYNLAMFGRATLQGQPS